MERITYRGWPNCYRVANKQLEVIATADVGPRIIHLSTLGGENLFVVLDEQAGLVGGTGWRLYGGHRLWHAPQAKPRSELPDNMPVEAVLDGQTLRLIQPLEVLSGIQKEIDVTLVADEAHVVVRHTLTNHGLWPVELAPWAISAMAPGGVAIVPQSVLPTPDGYLPNRLFALWPFTDACDPRLQWGRRYTLVRHDPSNELPFKIGLNATAGWAAYHWHGKLLIKTFRFDPRAMYPDMGSTVEVFACAHFLELETLGPLVRLQPRSSAEHVEHWFVYEGVAEVHDEPGVESIVRPLVDDALHLANQC